MKAYEEYKQEAFDMVLKEVGNDMVAQKYMDRVCLIANSLINIDILKVLSNKEDKETKEEPSADTEVKQKSEDVSLKPNPKPVKK